MNKQDPCSDADGPSTVAGTNAPVCSACPRPLEHDSYFLSLPTEILANIFTFLPAYDKLCVRITCKRIYSVLSDPVVWNSLVWRDCQRAEKDFKALRLSLNLASSVVQYVVISNSSLSNQGKFPYSKFVPQLQRCKYVRYLTITGMELSVTALKNLLSSLTNLYSLNVVTGEKIFCHDVVLVASKSQSLHTLTVSREDRLYRMLTAWQEGGYLPPDLRLKGAIHEDWSILSNYLEDFPKCEHPARLAFYPDTNQVVGNTLHIYPLFEISLFPTILCPLGLPSPLPSVVAMTKDKLVSDKYISAFHVHSKSALITNVSFLSESLQYISFARCKELCSENLTSISECCPNLIKFNIAGCELTLLQLNGLADIALKCTKLSGLCLTDIERHEVESVASLWEVLAGMGRLRHLSVSLSVMAPDREPPLPNQAKRRRMSHLGPYDKSSVDRIRTSIARMTNLVALETTEKYDLCRDAMLDLFLSAFVSLKHLRITNSLLPMLTSSTLSFTDILPCLPHLTFLYLCVPCQNLAFPTDPTYFHSLRQLYIHCPQLDLSNELVQGLVHHKRLTHVYLHVQMSIPSLERLIEGSPHLAECHLTIVCRELKLNSGAKRMIQSRLKERGVNYSLFVLIKTLVVEGMDCSEGSALESLWDTGKCTCTLFN